LFGPTVLGTAEKHTRSARFLLKAFNKQGGFDNVGDTADGVRELLEGSFRDVQVDVVGSNAFFAASRPKTST
jgi:hypothetical protein